MHPKMIIVSQTVRKHISGGDSDEYGHVCSFVFVWQKGKVVKWIGDSFEATQ